MTKTTVRNLKGTEKITFMVGDSTVTIQLTEENCEWVIPDEMLYHQGGYSICFNLDMRVTVEKEIPREFGAKIYNVVIGQNEEHHEELVSIDRKGKRWYGPDSLYSVFRRDISSFDLEKEESNED